MSIQRLLGVLLAGVTAWALGSMPVAAQSLFVTNGLGNSVFHYNLATGVPSAFASAGSGGLNDPAGLTFGPDGNLYVTGERVVAGVRTGSVFRYNGTTGAFIDVFADTGDPGSFGIKFGPDGNLYVANINLNSVSRFNGTTGAFIDNFVAAPDGGLNRPRDLVFGPDGHLYVASPGERTAPPTSQVRRFNGTTGALIGVFASAVDARGLAFGPGGDLYVASFSGDNVLRFDGVTGTFKAIFASGGGLDGPVGVLFGTDGNLYVSSFIGNEILRYDGSSGVLIDIFASGNGLANPRLMVNDTVPPVLTLPGNITMDATSPAGAAVNYTVTAKDNADPDPKVSCTPPGATFPIGTTTVTCTATDASGNSSTPGSFTVTVNGALAQLSNLIAIVGVYSNPFLGITNSLATKLQNAIDALNAMNKGSELSACNSLSAFINEAQAQSGKKLMPDGAQLIASAIQIRAVLGCP